MTAKGNLFTRRITPRGAGFYFYFYFISNFCLLGPCPMQDINVESIREVLQHRSRISYIRQLFVIGKEIPGATVEKILVNLSSSPHLSCTTISNSVIQSRQVLQSLPFPVRPTLLPLQNTISIVGI